mmetsp:Transcript_11234/g.14592  ORF Transcript_11234/g.14592 Transcript_11234/m.14592 type:complete len:238 (+) Transcript_11234:114-827(+)|eukprot:CAMPEP_0117737440 /NCGR_PEP_ID=MMETSP0947-20121206/2536_1 /TAXON_ID=44440 /ORGANISM="Chattonella subsalsa, Strain CCMP2191" /LENGTH=237 /DNA_ID=CAMNT_0005552941 /DNA_START=77 /DNA_END=790 /DNA_ORIENTATION=-
MGCCESRVIKTVEGPSVTGVLYAAYGNHNVTEKVRSAFHDGDEFINADNEVFHDKDLFVQKTLTVLFILENQDILWKTAEEGTTMSFIDIPSRRHTKTQYPTLPPGILFALYGEHDVSKDVRGKHRTSQMLNESTEFANKSELFEQVPVVNKGDLTIFFSMESEDLSHRVGFEGKKLTLGTDIPDMPEDIASDYHIYGVEAYQKIWNEDKQGDAYIDGTSWSSWFQKGNDQPSCSSQ